MRTKTTFSVALSAFMVGVMVAGVWPTYFGRLLRGDIERPLVVQIHRLVFVGWMTLLIAQVVLAWRGRVQMHRAYVISAVWLFVGATRILLTESEVWLPVGRAILGFFT